MSAVDDRVRLAEEALLQADAVVTHCLAQEMEAKLAYKRSKDATAEATAEQSRARHKLAVAEATARAESVMPAWTPDPVWRIPAKRHVMGQPRVVDVRDGWIVVRWNISDVMRYSTRTGWSHAGPWYMDLWGRLDVVETINAWRSACVARKAGGAL